jgi:group I intron endonuclease
MTINAQGVFNRGVVYLKTNLDNFKAYVGQTWRYEQRQYEHNRCAKNNPPFPLHRAMHKYQFDTQILALVGTQEELDNLERLWVAVLQTNNRHFGYNVGTAGVKGGESNRRGAKFTPEQLQRLSEAHKGQIGTWKGKKLHEDHKRALLDGLRRSQDRKRAAGIPSPVKGRKWSAEQRANLSKIQQARVAREKADGIVRTRKPSKPRSEEARQHMRDAWARMRKSGFYDEQRRRMSQGRRKGIDLRKCREEDTTSDR